MLILGIESSCDDTSVALLDCSNKGCLIVKEKTASQINIHKKYGGVVPELAGRAHAEKIVPLVKAIITKNKKPDVIAVASGPGLITGLLVGVEMARTLSYIWNVPLVAVNHIEGHIHSVEISNSQTPVSQLTNQPTNNQIKYPALALIASGGHTELIYLSKQGQYKKIGATKDDAAGECFDKIAKLLKLPYPGGPQISKLAKNGNPKIIQFPRPMLNSGDYNFSFSGLKTSALYWLRDNKLVTNEQKINQPTIYDFCASFQQAIVDVMIKKTIRATQQYKPKTIILGGGVSANSKLRKDLKKQINLHIKNCKLLVPDIKYAMDNAIMIAIAGYYKAKNKKFINWKKIKADPNWKL